MPIKQLVATVLFLFTINSVHSAMAIDQLERGKNRLKPGTVQEIQVIGQNILTAKHGEPPNPEFTLLRQRVEELQQAVEDLSVSSTSLEVTMGESSDISMTDGGKESKASDKYSERDRAKRENVKGVLGRVRAQRLKYESANDTRGSIKGEIEHRSVSKLKELEDDLDNVLKAPQDVQSAKLEALREHLKIHRRIVDQKQDETPTISTIVRHRQ